MDQAAIAIGPTSCAKSWCLHATDRSFIKGALDAPDRRCNVLLLTAARLHPRRRRQELLRIDEDRELAINTADNARCATPGIARSSRRMPVGVRVSSRADSVADAIAS